MKVINLPAMELWDERKEEFINTPAVTLRLEHSLLAISKWESEYEISFLDTLNKKEITDVQFRFYVQCMCLDEVDPKALVFLDSRTIEEIVAYINKPMTATRIRDDDKQKRRRIITSEQIYSWMTLYNIPFECEKWNLNRLTMLIRVCQEEAKKANGGSKVKPDLNARRARNEARKKRLRSKG